MRILLALFLMAHGTAHVIGFLGAWAPARTNTMSWNTLWLAGAALFVVAALGTLVNAAWWPGLTMGLAGASLALCILQLPATRFGVALNLALIALLVGGQRAGWY